MRIFAVSDVHGHANEFKELLLEAKLIDNDLNWLDQNNRLIICGDYIDRGPDSKGVVDLVINLLGNGANIKPLRGNHEDMLVQGVLKGNIGWLNCWLGNGGIKCLESYGLTIEQIKEAADFGGTYMCNLVKSVMGSHLPFLESQLLDYHIEEIQGEKNLFVHAGVYPPGKLQDLTEHYESGNAPMYLWVRSYFYNQQHDKFITKNYGVDRIIFGHSPTKYIIGNTGKKIERMEPVAKLNGRLLGIDTGSYYENGAITLVELLPKLDYKIINYKRKED